MAITFPLAASVFADKLRVESVSWRLRDNQQLSGMGSGQVLAADLAPRLWEADIQTYTLRPSCGAQVQAMIETLDGAINPFYLYNPKRPRPKADPGGSLGWFAANTWNFATDVEGWSAAGGMLTAAAGTVSFASINAAAFISSPAISVDGSKYRRVRLRLRRTAGTGTGYWHVAWKTTDHDFDPSLWQKAIPIPADLSQYSTITLDMSDLTGSSDAGGDDWITSTITGLRVYTVGLDQTVEFDWIDIGNDTFPGECRIASVTDANSMSLAGLPVGYVLSVGDLFAFDYGSPARRALHRVCEAVTADASGVTTAFTVRPHIRVGAAVDDVVNLYKPSAKMIMQPGTFQVSTSGFLATTTISFSAIQKL